MISLLLLRHELIDSFKYSLDFLIKVTENWQQKRLIIHHEVKKTKRS